MIISDKDHELVKRMVMSPNLMWRKEKEHMAIRFNIILDRYANNNRLYNRSEILEHVLYSAQLRLESRPRTIFILNPGSSGSHWLQLLIAQNYHAIGCGECYFPTEFMKYVKEASEAARGFLLDCAHIIHSDGEHIEIQNKMLINTAHLSGWRISDFMPQPSTKILLLRDPVDVVISRTFRKNEYRNKFFSNYDDLSYLNENIDYIIKFYSIAEKYQYDCIIKYEDMRSDLESVLNELAFILQSSPKFQLAGASNLNGRFLTEGNANKYRGPKIDIDEKYYQIARTSLGRLRSRMGYN